MLPSLPDGRGDLVKRLAFGRADGDAVLTMGLRHALGEAGHEPAVIGQLLRRRLALEQGDGLPQLLEAVLLELLWRVKAGVIDLGLREDDRVEQRALTVLLASLGIPLADREGLTERPTPRDRQGVCR